MTPYEAADVHVLVVGHAPTPFTADDIRRGCPVGRTIQQLIEPAGSEPIRRTSVFVGCDDDGALIERTRLTTDGEPVGERQPDRATWLELQRHASFPAAQTTIQPERLDTPMGPLDCLRYTVVEGSTVTLLWFADRAPGMPVKTVLVEDGHVTSTTTMVADSRLADLL